MNQVFSGQTICRRVEIYPDKNFLFDHTSRLPQDVIDTINSELTDIKVTHGYSIPLYLIQISQLQEKQLNFQLIVNQVLTDFIIEKALTTESLDEMLILFEQMEFTNPIAIQMLFKPGVTDNTAAAVKEAFGLRSELSGCNITVRSGRMYILNQLELKYTSNEFLKDLFFDKYANSLLHDLTILSSSELKSLDRFNLDKNIQFEIKVNDSNHVTEIKDLVTVIDFINLELNELKKLNQINCWAFSETEINFLKQYFTIQQKNPTDIETEVIAQTWSEHCKHKIFASEITYTEQNKDSVFPLIGDLKINSIFKTFIQGATLEIIKRRNLDWLVSIFHDNAGIVRFDPHVDVCIKVETHNSPSALDPYGGALTGILGVNRDILGCGQGALPIANTNVFCLAEDSYFKKNHIKIPQGLKNPDRIASGVHLGVQDGGNKSGIPTVNGAFYYAPEFVGKPLVFCGTIGVMPAVENNLPTSEKRHKVGDYIVMSGGAIGKDGIHGATFSSLELNQSIPNSVVQIGDPLTQKRLMDFLIQARRKNLFTSVTDNGAGGLSSSIGEMAQHTNGAIVHLDKAPTKYPGLLPFELMVSESQERMTFAIAPDKIDEFLKLSQDYNVVSTVVGEFTSSGYLIATYQKNIVAQIDLNFLHKGLPQMRLQATFDGHKNASNYTSNTAQHNTSVSKNENNLRIQLLNTLASSNVRSHEHLVRRYDHEVKASTIVKPFTGFTDYGYHSPNDAGVIWLDRYGGEKESSIAIGCGLAPHLSQQDTYLMAVAAADEAFRNCLVVGCDPEKVVLVDNFCWPDPIYSEKNLDGEHKLAQLVRAARGLYDLSVEYGAPFVSGKDSMKNDYHGPDGKVSILPTVLVTAMGHVAKISHVTTSIIKSENACVYLIGACDYLKTYNFSQQYKLYLKFHQAIQKGYIESAHDVSDGGLLSTLSEKILSSRFGLKINLNDQLQEDLFKEKLGQIVVSIHTECKTDFEKLFRMDEIQFLGITTEKREIILEKNQNIILQISALDLKNAYCCQSHPHHQTNEVSQ